MTVDSAGTPVEERVRALVEAHRADRGALLPILHDIQAEFGCIDQRSIAVLAAELNISRADVHGVVSFYTDFRSEPAGTTTVRLCRAEACKSVGAERLRGRMEQMFGVPVGQTTPDGSVTLEQVFCLGNCALGPAAQVNGRLYGRLDEAGLMELLAEGRS
ncbi:NADH-quinone oxidoreductase subunit NuoE family protein [Amycolatopsis aidingensis]|uniref:NADH-quinone oxidoreductase subunit NuoE family protein n=1 Tax=Amycolatopsis aidingensis TaxID=2842453 RepID=UPI001C0E79F9|nr:NAD(P)H-dependent oxidoreductase subunit E [Amycolatopsis aidingensis]